MACVGERLRCLRRSAFAPGVALIGVWATKPSGAPSFTSVMPNLIEDPHGLVFEYLDQDEGEFLYEVREDSCHDRGSRVLSRVLWFLG